MPKLAVVKCDDALTEPSENLTGYSSLRHLELVCVNLDLIAPRHWFSQLTQLESLTLRFDSSEFPLGLLHLKQLRSLNLRYCGLTRVELPPTMFEFLNFPALTCLDLSDSGLGAIPSGNANLLARLKRALCPGVLHY